MSRAQFFEESFTNTFGQLIQPGDKVAYVGTSYGSSILYQGVFAGVNYRTHEYGAKKGQRYISSIRIKDVPCRVFDWDSNTRTGIHRDTFRTASLQLKRVVKLAA